MLIRSILINIILNIIIHNIMAIDNNSFEKNLEFPDVCMGDSLKDCTNTLSTLIWNTHTWYDDQPINICKLKCIRRLTGHVSNFQWVWDAKFGCGEQTPEFLGRVQGYKIRQGAMKQAIAQFIEKSVTLGKLTLNDFKC